MINFKYIFLVLFLYSLNLRAQRCDEFDHALDTFNIYLKDVKNSDGSISPTPVFQQDNLAVIFACGHCLNSTGQAKNIKNRLVFTYTLGLHYYYDSKFTLATEQLNACMKNPRNTDLLPGRQTTYAEASRQLIREMSYPRHGSGTFTIYYNGKGGLVPQLLIEHGMEDTTTKYALWSEDQLLDFSKLAYLIKDSAKAINDYKTMFDDVDIKFTNPVLTIYHTDKSSVVKYPENRLPGDRNDSGASGGVNQVSQQRIDVNADKNIDGSQMNKPPNSPRQDMTQTAQYNAEHNVTAAENFLVNYDLYYSNFFNFLDRYFKKKYSDSLILTIHVIDSHYDTTIGRGYYLNTARKLHLPGPKGSLGYFNPIANSIVFWKPSGGGTLTHELTHAYLSNVFQGCPLWLNEGIASLFEEFSDSGDSDFIPNDNWRLIYIAEYYKLKSHHIPLSEIFSDTIPGSIVNDVLRKCYARYFCIYLKEKKLLPEALQLVNNNSQTAYAKKLSTLLKFNEVNNLQNDWEKWVIARGFGIGNRFNNKEYIKSVDRVLAVL